MRLRHARLTALASTLGAALALTASAQRPEDLSLPRLQRLLAGITVTPRVLIVGMNPDDVDPALVAWLTRGKHVETAFLAVTRGEAGQNFGGPEGGSTLGAIRVAEALAARQIDGGRQFFTRAIDPGPVTTAGQMFAVWPRDSIVGDVVQVIRAFRPHVMIAMLPDSITPGDGQREALGVIADQAFTSSADPRRFPTERFGLPWAVAKLYREGSGARIETATLDTSLGVTYEQIGMEARAQSRSQGLVDLTKPRPSVVTLHRVASRVNADRADTSLFDGVDTSFARLFAGDTGFVARALAIASANVDSARRALARVSRRAAAPPLAVVVRALTSAREVAARCKHPDADAALVVKRAAECGPHELDLDAALDVMRERAISGLLAAANITLEARADRELVATGDSATVAITLVNHGSEPATLADVTLNGRRAPSSIPVVVYPDSIGRIVRRVAGLEEPRPWWISNHDDGRYADVPSFIDGLVRLDAQRQTFVALGASSVVVPEDLRRTSDATVTLSVEGTTFRTSIGPIVYYHADGEVGLQPRPLAGVPAVTLRFGRALEWLPSGRPIARVLHVRVESHADSAIEVGFAKSIPLGVRIDSMPKEFTLAPHEQRDLFVPIHATLTGQQRLQLAVWGATEDGTAYMDGYQTIQRSYLPPIRVFRNSGTWLQPVNVSVPPKLSVIYVPDGSDDVRSSLSEIGVPAREVSPEDLLSVDLSLVSTVILGPHAFEMHPELTAQVGRLLDFMRRGGTLVLQRGDSTTLNSGLFPYHIALGTVAGHVLNPSAPVTEVVPGARLLTWPNQIGNADWNGWVLPRAELVPTEVDSRYGRIIATHDADAPASANTILTARVGKGILVYTTLLLDLQIAAAVPGAMRLLVNLASAGLSPGR